MTTNNTINDAVKPDTSNSKTSRSQATKSHGIPAAPPVEHAENYDEAPPGIPGPDFSARKQLKPTFNRGQSMMDYTAITSAGPTPANEIPNPMSSHMRGSRIRESHMPDQIESLRRGTINEADAERPRREPDDETRGEDEFGPSLSRQETETGARDHTSGWEGTNDAFGSHS